MKIRTLLTLTAIVSSILGAIVVYLLLSVPNDLRADGLLKEARQDLTAGKEDKAREKLTKIVQEYPRTDGAAAATVALVSLADKDSRQLAKTIGFLQQQHDQQRKTLVALQKTVDELKNAPPKIVTVAAPPAKKPVVKKKTPPKKKTTSKKRRR